MTPTTRSQARKQSQSPPSKIIPRRNPEDIRENSGSPDRVEEFATMFPAFVTAHVPLKILEELIDEAKSGLCGLLGDDEGMPGHCLCILDTMDLNSVVHGSRTPMQPFKSPFIGWTDNEVRSWMYAHKHPYFAQYTFIVLDKDTVKNKTCRIGYTDVNEPKGDKMLITDFYTSMHGLPALEIGPARWHWDDRVGTGKVYNRECFEEGRRKSHERYEQMEFERRQNEKKNLPGIHL